MLLKLPCDILWVIFTFVYNDDPTASTRTKLRAISSSCMNLAGSIANFWTTIILCKALHFNDITYAQTYIKKSKTLPLNVQISLPDAVELNIQKTAKTFTLLRKHVSRFRSINLHASNYGGIEDMLYIGRHKVATILQELTITVDKIRHVQEIDHFCTLSSAFTPARRLRKLCLPTSSIPREITTHFSFLTSLTIEGTVFESFEATSLLDILAAVAPRLKQFRYREGNERAPGGFVTAIHPSVMSFPSLRKVDITVPGVGLDLFHFIEAPGLLDLRLDGWRSDYEPDAGDGMREISITFILGRMAQRSQRVRKLELSFLKLHTQSHHYETLLCGELFPKLKELVLNTVNITDVAFFASAWIPTKLVKVAMIGCKHVTTQGLCDFVEGKALGFMVTVTNCSGILSVPRGLDLTLVVINP